MLDFDYSIPTQIFFGKGKVEVLVDEIKKYGDKVLILYGGGSVKKMGLYQKVVELLDKGNISYQELSGVQPNPRLTSVKDGVKICRQHGLNFVLAVGGGSVVDCAKAIAAGVCYEGDPWDFCIQKAQIKKAIPLASILTLAATGSEMNSGAVISNEETQQKYPMGSDLLKPKFSILDPGYTFSVPRNQTAAGTVDIMSHVLEQYFSPTKGVYLQDRIAEGILKTCIHYGPIAIEDPKNYEARANLMWSSSLALNGLIGYGRGSGDWATHMIEHEVSAIFDVTHGVGLAILTPHWMEHVLDETNEEKFATYARNIWGLENENTHELAKAGIKKTREFFNSLGVPSQLREVEVTEDSLEKMAKNATALYGALGNLKKLKEADVLSILKNAY